MKKNKKQGQLPDREYIRDGRAPIPEKKVTSKVMSTIRGKDTKPEILLRKALWANGMRGYRLHWKKVPGRPDISYPGRKIAIFVHGCYWHRCPHCDPSIPKSHKDFWREKFRKNKERDKKKKKALEEERWKVLTFWECQIKKDIEECVNKCRNIHSR